MAPPRRRGPLRAVLLCVVALTVLAPVGLVAVTALQRPAETAYANDDYQVPPPEAKPPPLPIPETAAQAQEWTRANAIYQQTMPAPIRCEVTRIDFVTADDATLKAHFEELIACLIRAWYLPTQQAGFILVRPTVTIYGDEVQTRCGKTGINAMYCGADQQVYYSRLIATRAPILEKNPWAADIIIAHEFGHAVQGRTGILGGDLVLENSEVDKHEQLLLSRRVETQADCFSGLFARSVSRSIGLKDSDTDLILDSYYRFGADVLRKQPNIESDHGLGATRRYWGQLGLANDAVTRCNTFSADKSLVR